MADTARIGSALVAGYLLGRTKKAKKAITLALWLTGKNKMLQPQNLAKMALTKLQDSPVAGEIITQIRGPLATAASKAALATLESRATAFADSLHEKTLALQPPGAEDAEADEDEAASEDAEDTQDTEDTEEAEGTGDEQAADDTDQEQEQEEDEPKQSRARSARSQPSTRAAKSRTSRSASSGRSGSSSRSKSGSSKRTSSSAKR